MKVFKIAYSMKILERMKFKPKDQDIHDFAIDLARGVCDNKTPYTYLPKASATLQEDGDTVIVKLSEGE